MCPGQEDGSTALPSSPRLKPPPKPPPLTPAPCLQLQGQTEAGALWSLLSTGGVASPPRTTCVIYLRPWKPQGPLSSWLPVSRAFGGSREKGPCLQPRIRIRIVDPRHRSARQPAPRILCSPPSLLSSHCILGARILALLGPFSTIWGLGNKASSLPRLTLPGEVRVELPHSAHQPQVRVLSRVSY